MSQCQELVFHNVVRAHFDTIIAKAQAGGIPISGDEGEAVKNGIAVRWSFSERDRSLRIQCVASPLMIPCSLINGRLVALVEDSR